MTEIVIGVAVGAAVAIIGQLIAFLFDLIKQKENERRKSEAVVKLLLQELTAHQTLYEHLLPWVDESIAKGGEQYTGYSYQPARTEAYEKVFLPNWHVLPDEVVTAVSEYYTTIEPLNILSGSSGTPAPVPITQVKGCVRNAQLKAGETRPILERHLSSKKQRAG